MHVLLDTHVLLWTLADDSWVRMELSGPAGSRIRDVAANEATIVAVGVRGDTLEAAAWTSTGGSPLQLVSVEGEGS